MDKYFVTMTFVYIVIIQTILSYLLISFSWLNPIVNYFSITLWVGVISCSYFVLRDYLE
jgi:hypothetical protein